MDNHSIFLSQRRFGSLDGLRALSIIAVIWHHTAPSWANATLALMGAQGVTLFFAISGFLITTLLLRERDRNGAIDLKAFYLRRTLRIFPLYYGVLLLYILAVTLVERNSAEGQAFFGNLPYFATYTSNIFVPLDGRVIFYFAWSLAAEEQFYLLWPPILYLLGAVSRAFIPLVVVVAACIAGQLVDNKFLSAIPLAIVAGALLASALHTRAGFFALKSVLGRAWSPVILAIALAIALAHTDMANFVVHLLCVALVGSCVVAEKHTLAPLLSMRPVAYIGSISYGMYMLHMLCKNAAVKFLDHFNLHVNGMEIFVVTLAVSILAASLSFKYYESIFLKMKRSHER